MTGTVERKKLLALLVAGGKIVARRTVPFPHRYFLDGLDDRGPAIQEPVHSYEIAEHVVADFVSAKILKPRGIGALWDEIAYDVISPFSIEHDAREYFPCGFGQCAVCGDFPLGAGVKANAPRHGITVSYGEVVPTKTPCTGTGQPLVNVHLHTPRAKVDRVA